MLLSTLAFLPLSSIHATCSQRIRRSRSAPRAHHRATDDDRHRRRYRQRASFSAAALQSAWPAGGAGELRHRRAHRAAAHGLTRGDGRCPPGDRLVRSLCRAVSLAVSRAFSFATAIGRAWCSRWARRFPPSPSTCTTGCRTLPAGCGFCFSPPALVLVNALHVGTFGAVEYSFSLVKVLSICGFLLLGGYLVLRAPHAAAANLTTHGGFFPHGAWGMWQAVVVALFSYFSLEMVAVAAGEARDPRTAVVRAFRGTLCGSSCFISGRSRSRWLWFRGTPAQRRQARSSGAMQAAAIPYAAGVLNLIVLVAALSAMNSQLYITSRMMFSLARAGFAPARFGSLLAPACHSRPCCFLPSASP